MIASESSRLSKERTIRLNYRNENATPCARYAGCNTQSQRREQTKGGPLGLCNERVECQRTGCNNQKPQHSCRCNHQRGCGAKGVCGSDNGYICGEAPIAMVYSPMQKWRELYDPHTALMSGTIFKELDLPFYPTPCKRKESSQCQCR